MANIAEYLSQVQALTKTNLELLQALNDSFLTKREHLSVTVNGANYIIPSFLAIENKINALTENLNNLVYAPKTGEANFIFDGNSRSIEVKGYTCTPNRLSIDVATIDGFSVEQNDVFKDFLTPNPYIKIDLQSLPNDIATVNVRKVIAKSDELKSIAQTALGGGTIVGQSWADLYKILSLYREDVDYVMYDTIRQLPIRKNIGSGVYTIKSIDNDITDKYLDNYITVTVAEDLKYKLFDETVEKYLKEGDELVTYDDSAKMVITDVNAAKRQITFKVLNGDYLNLVADAGDETYVSDLSKIKFFSPVDYDKDKYINIPLEEDRFVYAFVAPLNSRMNVQAPWGDGLLVDTDLIKWTDDGQTTFKQYYENNVRNIGDILYEISSVMSNTIMKYSEDDFKRFSQYHPILNEDTLRVVQINTHLNNSVTATNIRALYSQKQEYKRELDELNGKINDVNKALAEIAFTDTSGVRSAYESQLSQYNERKNELNTSITKLIQEISTAANDSVIPLENAKYHIRGFYNWNNDNEEVLSLYKDHIHGIKVQYRYKNVDHTTGTALSMQNGKFIFSDWNDMPSFLLQKNPEYNDGFKFGYPQFEGTQDNGKLNEPSFNQIDIPISQGETVDIRLKIVWDFGYPFIESTSDWSEILNIAFPDELLKDVQVLDIVEENNNEIENNHFYNMLKEDGIIDHVGDRLVDQDVTFYHKPENISSGFYTEERRVIPLRDKLASLDQSVITLQDMINGTNSTNLEVSIILDGVENIIQPDKNNVFTLPAYSTTPANSATSGDDRIYTMMATLQIANTSNHVSYLYSLFPGNRDITINELTHAKFTKSDYCDGTDKGVWLGYPQITTTETGSGTNSSTTTTNETQFKLQTSNQWLTFRINNAYTGAAYYAANGQFRENNILSSSSKYQMLVIDEQDTENSPIMSIYPYLSDESALVITGDSVYNKMQLAPGESLIVPLVIQYFVKSGSIEKTITFDIRPSLYSDPTNFVVTLRANNTDTVQEKTTKAAKARLINQAQVIDAGAISRSAADTQINIGLSLDKSRYKKTIKNQ